MVQERTKEKRRTAHRAEEERTRPTLDTTCGFRAVSGVGDLNPVFGSEGREKGHDMMRYAWAGRIPTLGRTTPGRKRSRGDGSCPSLYLLDHYTHALYARLAQHDGSPTRLGPSSSPRAGRLCPRRPDERLQRTTGPGFSQAAKPGSSHVGAAPRAAATPSHDGSKHASEPLFRLAGAVA